MPLEYEQLKDKPLFMYCHYCGVPLEGAKDLQVDRGLVQSRWRRWLGLAYCAVVCKYCGTFNWEKP